MPAGRPTKYDPAYCEMVVEVCATGHSLTGFAGKIGVARDTITEWANAHPEFSVAVTRAKAACAAWWEERLMDRARSGEGSATAAVFGVKNMAPDDWRDRQEVTGANGTSLLQVAFVEPPKAD